MSWRERAAAPLLLLPLAACGFHPLYARNSTLGYDPTLAAIEVHPVPNRVGQILVASVREQLNPQDVSLKRRYVLTIALAESRSELGIRRDNTSTRGELSLDASMELNDTASNKVVYHGTVRSVTSFNLPNDAYAATTAEENAEQQAATDLGREIAQRIAISVRQRQAGGEGGT